MTTKLKPPSTRPAKPKDAASHAKTGDGGPVLLTGELLRKAREDRGLTIDMVANELMIRRFYLDALENGALRDLPERVYATGFVKNYAHYIGLDTFAVVEQFKKEAYGARNVGGYQVELNMPQPVIHSVVPGRSALITAVIVLALLIAGVIFATQSGKKQLGTIIPQPAISDETPAAELPVAAHETNNAAPVLEVPAASSTPAAAPVETPPAASVVPATVQNRRVLEALQSSWVEVKDNKGVILFTSILKAGQLLPLPDNIRISVTMGNSGGVRLLLDGQPQPAFGAVNEVKRNVIVEAPAPLKNR